MKTAAPLTVAVQIRLTKESAKRYAERARAKKMTLSAWIRWVLARTA